jgi:acyl carrier protein
LELSSEAITDELAQDEVPTWDSLRHLQLVATLEEVYRVRLSTREIMMLRSVGDVRAVLRGKAVPV